MNETGVCPLTASTDQGPAKLGLRANPLPLSRENQFWLFQFAGWSGWVLIQVLRDLTFVPAEYIFTRALIFALSALVGVMMTTGLRYAYRYVWEKGAAWRIAVVWIGSLTVALIWRPIHNTIVLIPFGEFPDFSSGDLSGILNGSLSFSFPLILSWSSLYFIIKYSQLFQAEKEKNLRAESLAHEAQLLMLRYQLNPHFLFNTLNAISTLVMEKSNTKANEMIIKLSKFLRYSLDSSPLDKVDLSYEIQTSLLYLDIEKVRFEERLRLEVKVSEAASKALVPSMILQPLIENSIKYAISQSLDGGSIGLFAEVHHNKLILNIEDSGAGVKDAFDAKALASSTGVGLSNIRNRLNEIYGDSHELIFSNIEPAGCKVTVIIPYDTK